MHSRHCVGDQLVLKGDLLGNRMQNGEEAETEKKERPGGAGIVYKVQSLSRDSRDGELMAWECPYAEDLGKATSDEDRVRPARRQRSWR